MFLYKLFFVLVLIVYGFLKAQNNMIHLNDQAQFMKNPSFDYFIDSSGSMTLEEVKQLDARRFYQHHNQENLNLGLLGKTVWLKLPFRNADPKYDKYVFYINYSLLDSVFLYQYSQNENYAPMEQGELYPSYTRYYDTKNIVFPIKAPLEEQQVIYVKIKTSGSVYLPITITSEPYLYNYEKNKYIYYGLFYGAILVVLIYNFFLFFTLRDFIYLLYNIYIIVTVTAISTFNGFISYFGIFDENRNLLNHLFSNFAVLTNIISCLFCYLFLELENKERIGAIILKFFILLGVIIWLFSFFMPYKITASFASTLFIITPCFIFFISLYSWYKGNDVARFYLFATTFFMVSVALTSFRILGFIKGNDSQEFMLEIGIVIDTIFISLALADKLRKLDIERIKAQNNERIAIQDKERFISEQNNILETKIGSRTEEILEKSKKLESFSQTITEQNELIKKYNDNLEQQIEERTKQIVYSNMQLEKKTMRLEQFTYIVSHNLKSPVNNLNTLLDFVNESNLDEETQEYFKVIKKTNQQLKNIIDDINILVTHDKETEIELTEVNLVKEIENIKDKLIIQILDSSCEIITDFKANYFRSFPPYITSILYNLINNSIKYRSMDRSIKIWVESMYTENHLVLKVRDNGKGIPPSELEHVFKLFYKIDHEQEGKGMGLFLVKSQVEQLGGKVVIESELDRGTQFTITIPWS